MLGRFSRGVAEPAVDAVGIVVDDDDDDGGDGGFDDKNENTAAFSVGNFEESDTREVGASGEAMLGGTAVSVLTRIATSASSSVVSNDPSSPSSASVTHAVSDDDDVENVNAGGPLAAN